VIALSPPTDGCPRAPGRPRDERASRAITAAARRQLAELGYARLSMESVAAEAGVARATVYRRYRDKADLVTAAIADAEGSLPPAGEDPRQDLARFLAQFDARFAEHCLEVLGALLGAREDPRALALHRRRVIEPRLAHARGLLERARDLGQLDADADLDLALQMLVGAVFARRVAGARSSRGWAERAVDLVWAGMGPAGR
jgi:AcrR family transcriptional regulator